MKQMRRASVATWEIERHLTSHSQDRWNSLPRTTVAVIGLTLLSFLILFTTACSLPGAADPPSNLSLSLRLASTSPTETTPVHSTVGALSLSQVDIGLVVVAESTLASEGIQDRLVEDLLSGQPAIRTEAAYVGRFNSLLPGDSPSELVNGLLPNAWYFVAVTAVPYDAGGNADLPVYGWTRVQTVAGSTAAAEIVVELSASQFNTALFDRYGLVLGAPIEGLSLDIFLVNPVGDDLNFDALPSPFVVERTTELPLTVSATPGFATYGWTLAGETTHIDGGFGNPWEAQILGTTPLGIHQITLIVTDAAGAPLSEQFSIQVVEN